MLIMCATPFCAVYYLKATFGPNTANAILQIPLSVSAGNMVFGFYYQVSSPKIVLEIYTWRNGSVAVTETRRHERGLWTALYAAVDSGVDLVELHAKKIGVTTTTEFVLVDPVEVVTYSRIGSISPLHRAMFAIG